MTLDEFYLEYAADETAEIPEYLGPNAERSIAALQIKLGEAANRSVSRDEVIRAVFNEWRVHKGRP